MFEEDVTGLDVEQTLSAAGEARMLADRNEAFILALAAHFADLHPATGAGMARLGRSLPGMERPVILGGDGTPEVAEFAAAEQRARRSAEEQGVWVNLSNDHGIGSVFIKSETPNIVWFDDVADQHDHSGRPHHDYPSTGDWAAFMRPSRMQCECGCHTGQRIDPARLLPPATLYLHLNEDSFTRDADGVARFEGHGPITIGQARDFLAHCHVTIKPVIDLHNQAPVDAYEIPDRLREAVQLRSPADVFPYATNVSRSMDQDHTKPYIPPDDGGPPGQTSLGNLGPLTRRHHRIKTHSRWRVKQPFSGIFIWRSPHDRYYLVDHTGTHKLPRAG